MAAELAAGGSIETRRRIVHYGDGAVFRRDSMPDVKSKLPLLSRRTSVASALMLAHGKDHGDHE